MDFDWPAFFDRHNIPWVDSGKSVTPGNIAIQCPWCGDADHSENLSVSLHGKGYRCWRVPNVHKGGSPVGLIQELLGCSWGEAYRLAGHEARGPALGSSELVQRARDLLSPKQGNKKVEGIEFPSSFHRVQNKGFGRFFVNYLIEERGYINVAQAETVAERYSLRWSRSGVYAYRLIIPIFMNGMLVNWTGRHIGESDLRYLTLTTDVEKSEKLDVPPAAISIEQTLWNYDELVYGGEELLICEGPMDAMKLDFFGRHRGIRATCVFKKQISDAQVTLLTSVASMFKRISIVLDSDAKFDSLPMQTTLAHLACGVRRIPSDFKDPAEMPPQAVREFFRSFEWMLKSVAWAEKWDNLGTWKKSNPR